MSKDNIFVEPTEDELRSLEKFLSQRSSYPAEGIRARQKFELAAKVVGLYRRRFVPSD